MPRLSPGQPYYTITTLADAAELTGVIPLTRPGDILDNADLVVAHVAARAEELADLIEPVYATVEDVIDAYPELIGTRTITRTDEAGTVHSTEVPIIVPHTFNTVWERNSQEN